MANSEQPADFLAIPTVGNTTTVQQEKTVFRFGKISVQIEVNYAEK